MILPSNVHAPKCKVCMDQRSIAVGKEVFHVSHTGDDHSKA